MSQSHAGEGEVAQALFDTARAVGEIDLGDCELIVAEHESDVLEPGAATVKESGDGAAQVLLMPTSP